METVIFKGNEIVTCTDCVTGKTMELVFQEGAVTNIIERATREANVPFVGPGLVDLQINGSHFSTGFINSDF